MKIFLNAVSAEFFREFRNFFTSATGYLFFILFLLLINLLTFAQGQFFELGEASLASSFFAWHPMLLALFVPAIGMRVWAEDNRRGTSEILFSFPIPLASLVVGKYLSVITVIVLGLACTFPLVISVASMGDLDMGAVATGYIGSFLVILALAAVTCFCSSLVESQVIAFIVAASFSFILVLVSSSKITEEAINVFPQYKSAVDFFSSLGMSHYHSRFALGLLELKGILYFLIITICGLVLNWITIRRKIIHP